MSYRVLADQIEEDIEPLEQQEVQSAMRVVCAKAVDADEARLFIDMLGLMEPIAESEIKSA